MPRRKILRKIYNPPHFKGFTPVGLREEQPGKPVFLGFEEYESVRLADFEGYHQSEAARIMNVSRPTFARIYEDARRKIASAFVQGIPILFEGGKIYYDSEWYECRHCGSRFNQIHKAVPVTGCALCGAENVFPVEPPVQNREDGHRCLCPACGNETVVAKGIPCSHAVCEKCGIRLRRNWKRSYD